MNASNITVSIHALRNDLKLLANKERALVSQRFFKTGKGEYGEGDTFLGITVPQLRKLSKGYKSLSIKEIDSLIKSSFHEERLLSFD